MIVPPSNNTLEPVICPLDFINKPLELISVSLIVNPPIVPSPAFILPDIVIPAADADNTVLFAAVFIENEFVLSKYIKKLYLIPNIEIKVVSFSFANKEINIILGNTSSL